MNLSSQSNLNLIPMWSCLLLTITNRLRMRILRNYGRCSDSVKRNDV